MFTGVALYREYVGTRFDKTTGQQVPNSMWQTKPVSMIAKCAEALALRKAFPQDLSGLYTADEMQQADSAGMETIEAEIVDEPAHERPRRQYAKPVRQGMPEQSQAPKAGVASPAQLKEVTDILRANGVKPDDAGRFIGNVLHDSTVTSTTLTAIQAQTFIDEYHKYMSQQQAKKENSNEQA